MVCRFCGLPTETDLGHTTETECIEALEREVKRLKAALKHAPAPDALTGPAAVPALSLQPVHPEPRP